MAELDVASPSPHVELWTILGAPRRNTLTRALVSALGSELRRVEGGEARAVVLTGEGEQAFCAGADLKERRLMSADEVRGFLGELRRLLLGMERQRAVFIAALEGSAFGGGTELALACDLRVASEAATLALTEVTLGIIPGGGGTQRLPRLVGPGRARDMILTGRRVSAHEGLGWGLVDRLAPKGQAVSTAVGLGALVAANAPIAVGLAKNAIRDGLEATLEEGLEIEHREYEKTLGTQDRLEGLAAFAEKRKP
ncbi:MAG TPA: enoyl-CoA hydratase-related protein, partial [Myxococcales bacterium]|nr:enoyl-CoA hydratase-related protein [Myxococcales bacterium]